MRTAWLLGGLLLVPRAGHAQAPVVDSIRRPDTVVVRAFGKVYYPATEVDSSRARVTICFQTRTGTINSNSVCSTSVWGPWRNDAARKPDAPGTLTVILLSE